MKPMLTNKPMKTLAVLLCTLTAAVCLLCTLTTALLAAADAYSGNARPFTESWLYGHTAEPYENDAWMLYLSKQEGAYHVADADKIEQSLDGRATAFRYALTDANGALVAGTAAPANRADVRERLYGYTDDAEQDHRFTMLSWIDAGSGVTDALTRRAALYQGAYAFRTGFAVIAAVALVATVLLLCYLGCAAGRYADSDAPEVRYLNRLPIDLYFLLAAGLSGLLAMAGVSAFDLSLEFGAFLTACAVLAASAMGVGFVMAFCARVKTRTLWRTSVIGFVCRLVWRLLCWVGRGVRGLFMNLPLLWKYVLGYAAFGVINLVGVGGHRGFFALLMFVVDVGVLALLCGYAVSLDKLRRAAAAMAAGDLGCTVDTSRMPRTLRMHGEDLNRIRGAVSAAVESRVKSERMKTDLITNVSHDIKTPLTAIVSYVDLLQKEDLQSAQAKEYVAVLARQAERLKKLTCDLVDASKASSGALNVAVERVDLSELVRQSEAEYAERFAAGGLTLAASAPTTPLLAAADGRLLWRVFDNLLGTALKYALPGTRVYLDAAAGADGACLVTLKNVSREPLNVTADELTERFVRGDASRASEGSGLGLSIAKDLMRLMHGALTLRVDGDLFKAELTLPPYAD